MKTGNALVSLLLLLNFALPVSANGSCALKLSGDANCDNKIDLNDFEQFRKEYNREVNTKLTDFNQDDKISLADFEIWRSHIGMQAPTATASTTSAPTATARPSATNAPTPTLRPTITTSPTTPPQTSTDCKPFYSASSPWNTKLGASPQLEAGGSTSRLTTIITEGIGSRVIQYTMPLYIVDNTTPLKTITFGGAFSEVVNDKVNVTLHGSVSVPMPNGALPAEGTDSQIILWNKSTGDEWGFWKVVVSGGTYTFENGYHYNTNWDGVPPIKGETGPGIDGKTVTSSNFVSRGAGVPYLTGLIRPCEIKQGHIDHAIAFAYDYPKAEFIYPATKSDGKGDAQDLPEGARLQLNPSLTDAQLQGFGCQAACLTIAHAMQQYGMIVIDKSDHPKIYAEYDGTAHWNGVITDSTVKSIPINQFRLIATGGK